MTDIPFGSAGSLDLVERVAALHRIELFARVPGRVLVAVAEAVDELRLSPDGSKLAFSTSGLLRIVEVSTGRALLDTRSGGPMARVAWSPHRDVLALVNMSADVVVMAPGGDVLYTVRHPGSVTEAAFSPDGALLATASNSQAVRLCDAASGQSLRELRLPRFARYLAWSPDGACLALTAGESTYLWRLDTDELSLIDSRQGMPRRPEWHPTGQLLASSGADRRIRVTEVTTNEILCELAGQATHPVLRWAPDGGGMLLTTTDTAVQEVLLDGSRNGTC